MTTTVERPQDHAQAPLRLNGEEGADFLQSVNILLLAEPLRLLL